MRLAATRLARRLARDGTILFGLLYALASLAGYAPPPGDLEIYWATGLQYPEVYAPATPGSGMATPYPPPFLVLFAALHLLPWPVVVIGWQVATFAALWYLARTWAPLVIAAGIAFAFVPELTPIGAPFQVAAHGNAHLLMSAAVVAGLRHPGAWAGALLTKMTPGVGLLWYVLRREWRPLGVALGVTAAIALASVAVWPTGWPEYIAFGLRNIGGSESWGPPFAVRLAMSVALLAVGAWRGWLWTVPIAAGWAVLVLYPWWMVTTWLGVIPLLRRKEAPAISEETTGARRRAAHGHATRVFPRRLRSP